MTLKLSVYDVHASFAALAPTRGVARVGGWGWVCSTGLGLASHGLVAF